MSVSLDIWLEGTNHLAEVAQVAGLRSLNHMSAELGEYRADLDGWSVQVSHREPGTAVEEFNLVYDLRIHFGDYGVTDSWFEAQYRVLINLIKEYGHLRGVMHNDHVPWLAWQFSEVTVPRLDKHPTQLPHYEEAGELLELMLKRAGIGLRKVSLDEMWDGRQFDGPSDEWLLARSRQRFESHEPIDCVSSPQPTDVEALMTAAIRLEREFYAFEWLETLKPTVDVVGPWLSKALEDPPMFKAIGDVWPEACYLLGVDQYHPMRKTQQHIDAFRAEIVATVD